VVSLGGARSNRYALLGGIDSITRPGTCRVAFIILHDDSRTLAGAHSDLHGKTRRDQGKGSKHCRFFGLSSSRSRRHTPLQTGFRSGGEGSTAAPRVDPGSGETI